MTDITAAHRFVTLHARLIDRRRITGDSALVRAALAAYQNPDGGIAYLEPDLPDPASQPIAALAALEILHEIGAPADDPLLTGVIGWLAGVSGADGDLPGVLPYDPSAVPHAPWLAPVAEPPASLLMTAAVAAAAYRAGVGGGPGRAWLDRTSAFVWERIGRRDPSSAYETKYVIDFLDAVPDRARAEAALSELAAALGQPASLRVGGGADGEVLTALSVTPRPDHAGRRLFDPAAIERQLDELAAGQRDDGGWMFDWLAWNDAVAWAWRGRISVDAIATLRANGRIG
jgi:hypothetical protein